MGVGCAVWVPEILKLRSRRIYSVLRCRTSAQTVRRNVRFLYNFRDIFLNSGVLWVDKKRTKTRHYFQDNDHHPGPSIEETSLVAEARAGRRTEPPRTETCPGHAPGASSASQLRLFVLQLHILTIESHPKPETLSLQQRGRKHKRVRETAASSAQCAGFQIPSFSRNTNLPFGVLCSPTTYPRSKRRGLDP